MLSTSFVCLLVLFFTVAVQASPLNDGQGRRMFNGNPNMRTRMLRKRQASVSSNSTSGITSSSDAFCQQFSAGCIQVAMQGKQSGQVQLVQSCQKTGDANTYNYAFGCKADGVDVTQIVLDSTGSQYTFTFSTTSLSTRTLAPLTIASTVIQVSNTTARVNATTQTTSVVTVPTTVSTSVATQVLLGTNTIPAIQVTLLSSASAISTKLTKRLFWQPAAPTTTAKTTSTTAKATTSSSTSVASSSSSTKSTSTTLTSSSAKMTSSTTSSSSSAAASSTNSVSPFCSAFAASCSSLCGSINSSPQVSTCTSSAASTYTLQCYCKSQQSIVSYVLNDVAGKFKTPIRQINTIASTATVQPTTTSVQINVVTSTVATITSIATAVTTVTSVVPVTASSTTQLILAPTGRIAVRTVDGAIDGGFLTKSEPESLITASLVYPDNDPITFMAVGDATTGAYQLQVADGSGDVLAFEMGFGVDSNDFGAGSSGYAFAERTPAGSCASAGQAPSGSGVIAGNSCTSYVWSPTFNSTLSNSLLDFEPTWLVNDIQTQTPTLLFDNTGYALLLVADPAAYALANQAETYLVRLTFPA